MTTKQSEQALIKQSIDTAVSDLDAIREIDRWIVYLLESIEEDIGIEMLSRIRYVLDKRFEVGRW